MSCIPSIPRSFQLPPLHSICSWKAWCSPHHQQVFTQSHHWASSYDVLSPFKRELFDRTKSELLASWAYPYAAPDRLRLCCDFNSLLWIVEEISDDQSGKDAVATGSAFLRALGDEWYDDSTEFCRMIKDFRTRCLAVTSDVSYNRLLRYVEHYVNGVTAEAELREKDIVLGEDAFTAIRHANGGVLPMFGMFGCSLGLDLPDYVFENPIFNAMLDEGVDLVTVSNDIYSYKKEQYSDNYANNILTVLQKEKNMTLQEAVDHAAAHFKALVESFEKNRKCLPSFGEEIDEIVQQYVNAVQYVVSGNLEWSFESQRYFGDSGAAIRQSGVVELFPPGTPFSSQE